MVMVLVLLSLLRIFRFKLQLKVRLWLCILHFFPVSLVTTGGNIILPIPGKLFMRSWYQYYYILYEQFTWNFSSWLRINLDYVRSRLIRLTFLTSFVVPDDTVYFQLKLGLNFTLVPTNLYPNQTFDIEIKTLETVTNPLNVILWTWIVPAQQTILMQLGP